MANKAAAAVDLDWRGPGAGRRWRRDFKWSTVLWSLVFPAQSQRIALTLPGVLLIALALGLGTAAYNTANNILFIALSLLLSCLILSGLMSWLNFAGVRWRMEAAPALRAGCDAPVSVELRSAKKMLPTYGLWFDLRAVAVRANDGKEPPEKTVREILAAADRAEARARLFLRGRLDAGEAARLEWILRPARRGALRLELAGVGSLFPFGFLKKSLDGGLRREVTVWPAPVEYRRWGAAAASRPFAAERAARPGGGADLLALRHYAPGDSHRLIHWKASARARRLLVRQFAAESAEGFALWLQTPAEVWTRPEQFELLVSFAATLAEDLFRGGRLTGVAVNAEPPQALRGGRDLEKFLNRLAVVEPVAEGRPPASGEKTVFTKRNLITFAPDGARGVAAYVDGEKTAAA